MPDVPVRWDARVVRYLEFYKTNPRGRSMIDELAQAERPLRRRHPPHPPREQPPGGHRLARPRRERLQSHHPVARGGGRPLAVHARGRAHLRAHRRPLDRRAPRPRALHPRRGPLPRRPAHPLRELGARLRRLQHGLRRPARVHPQVQHQRLLGAVAPGGGHAPRDGALRAQESSRWPSSPATAACSASTTSSSIPRSPSTRSRCAPASRSSPSPSPPAPPPTRSPSSTPSSPPAAPPRSWRAP